VLAARHRDPLHVVRIGLLLQGAVIAVMSQAPSIGFAFLGAAAFGAATSATLTAAMSAVQELVPEDRRVLGFTAFHVLIRVGLSVAAIGAGVAADLVDGQRWPLLGELPPSRVVLFGAGATVVVAALLVGPRLRRDRLADGAIASAGGGPDLVAVEEEPREHDLADVAVDPPVPGEALDEHRCDDGRGGDRSPPASEPAEQRHDREVGHEAADRGLTGEATDGEAGEERGGARPGLDAECSDRG
jgi:hypothetical protein